MRVSTKADYALRALIEMAQARTQARSQVGTEVSKGARAQTNAQGGGSAGAGNGVKEGPLSAEELGRRQDIPHGFLQAILADLRRAGVVVAQRGQSGGWRLNREASDISIADVIRAVDGPLVSVYGVRPEAVSYNDHAQVLQPVWIAARSALRDVFEQVSIDHLATGDLPDVVTSRTADDDAWRPH